MSDSFDIPKLISAAKDRVATLADGEGLFIVGGKLVASREPQPLETFCIAVGGSGEATDWHSVEEALSEYATWG